MNADTRKGFLISDLEGLTDPFYRNVANNVMFGIRDQVNGNDRIISDFVDARFSGSLPFDQVLSRALAMAWRYTQGSAPVPLMTLRGWVGGDLRATVFEPEDWCRLAATVARADGGSSCRASGASTRRLRVLGDSRSHHETFAIAESPWGRIGFHSANASQGVTGPDDCAAGVMTLILGMTDKDEFLAFAAARAGLDAQPRAVLLILFMPDPGLAPARHVAGPVRNHWRPSNAAITHISGSYLTEQVALASDLAKATDGFTDDATWHNLEHRQAVFEHLSERLGRAPTARELYDTMAGDSPLRAILTPNLIQAFPELEQVFHCIGDPVWDEMSPNERYALVVRLTQEEEIKARTEV
jgi:hypothetical protein